MELNRNTFIYTGAIVNITQYLWKYCVLFTGSLTNCARLIQCAICNLKYRSKCATFKKAVKLCLTEERLDRQLRGEFWSLRVRSYQTLWQAFVASFDKPQSSCEVCGFPALLFCQRHQWQTAADAQKIFLVLFSVNYCWWNQVFFLQQVDFSHSNLSAEAV